MTQQLHVPDPERSKRTQCMAEQAITQSLKTIEKLDLVIKAVEEEIHNGSPGK